MAYLRWSNSCWYVFETIYFSSSEPSLVIWHCDIKQSEDFLHFTYSQLKDIKTIEDLKQVINTSLTVSDKDWVKLLNAIHEWLDNCGTI